jgi:glycosyltransferase involved in cell wall biosynthesis
MKIDGKMGELLKTEESEDFKCPSTPSYRVARVSTVPFFLVSQLGGQIKYLSNKGAQVTVVTSSGPELQQLINQNVMIQNIEISRSISLLKDTVALFQLWRLFRLYGFDIVHSTTPKAGLLCAIAGALARIPVRLHTFTGQPWVNMSGFLRLIAKKADWLIGRLNTQCYTDSESQRNFLIAQKLLPPERLIVLGKGSLAGVDLRRFDAARWTAVERSALRRKLGLGEHGRIILFVGRICSDKGISELLQAFEALSKEGYEADLLLVGPLDNERGDVIDVTSLRRVRHVGYTDCPECYMALADFLCLPSYREGFGTVVIEAAAMGIPTVGTRIYGLTDAVQDGVTGLLVPPQNGEALLGAMRSLLDAPDYLASMGKAARRRCIEDFDSDKINALVAKEYERLLTR